MNILLAEDDPNISTIAVMALEHIGGHNVTLVTDGATALEVATQGEFDVILLDEMMPKMNGLAVCKTLKQNQSFQTPVIFLSAKSQATDVEAFLQTGTGFIPKPFDPMKLNQQIDEVLKPSEAAV